MATTMKAAVLHEFGRKLEFEDVPVPEPKAGQVLVKVAACGVCHSDVHAVDGDWPFKPNPPFIPGHEVAGCVAAVGPGVTSLKEGDRVGIGWMHSACGVCDCCLTGWENLCRRIKSTGYGVDGGFAEYLIGEADYVARVPDEVTFEQVAPLLCAGIASYKGLKETDARPGEWVVVSGVGGLGHLAIQYAKVLGLKVAAVDVADEKLAFARELGAEFTVNAKSEDAARSIRKGIGGAHGVVVTAASAQAYNDALGMLRERGRLVLVAMPPGELSVPIVATVARGLTIRGSGGGSRKDMLETLQFAAEGKVTADVTTRPFESVNEVLEELRRGDVHGRIVLNIG